MLGYSTLSGAQNSYIATDDTGARVQLTSPARRVVALSPHAVELIHAAGGGHTLVGAVEYSDYPPSALQLPRVGSHAGFDLERIAALKPDLIVAWPLGGERQLQRIESLGVAVFRSAPRTLEAIATSIEQLGVLLDTRTVAKQQAQQFRQRLQDLRARYVGAPTVRVFYQTWEQPLMTIGGQHTINEALTLCGGRNIFADLRLPAPVVSQEAVLERSPQLVIGNTSGWSNYKGVSVTLPGDLLARPTPRLLDGVSLLCKAIEQARLSQATEGRRKAETN